EVQKLTENGKAKAKDKTKAKEYIAAFVKERGLKTGATTDFVSEWTIADDPGMAPLKAVLDKPGASPHGTAPIPFGQRFFYEPGRLGGRAPATGTYEPAFYPERAAETARFSLDKTEP